MEPVNFTITSSDDAENPLRFELGPNDAPLKVGRGKKSGLMIDRNGISWVHMEIKPWTKGAEDAPPSLCITDISSNGVGLRRTKNSDLQRVEKEEETEVPHGAVLVLPYRVKVAEGQTEDSLRTSLTVTIDGVVSPSSELSESEPEDAMDVSVPAESSGARDRSRSRSPRKDLFNPEEEPVVDQKSKKKDGEKTSKKAHSLKSGEFVKVVNLKGKVSQLNGKVGLLVEFDSEKGAWKVRMEDGSGKAFRPANLRPHKVQKPTMPGPSQPPAAPPAPPPSAPLEAGQATEPPPPPDEPPTKAPGAANGEMAPQPVATNEFVSKAAPRSFSKQSPAAVPAKAVVGVAIPKMPLPMPLVPMGVGLPMPGLGMIPAMPPLLGMPMMPPLVGVVPPLPVTLPGQRMPMLNPLPPRPPK